MRILVVEDDHQLRAQLVAALKEHQYVVDSAEDGEEAVFLGQENHFDLTIVDLGLPKMNGIEVITQWRANNRTFPILILTARDNWQDKVEGLNAGADDYVVKPFHLAELLARVSALLRRSTGHATSRLNFGRLSVELTAKQVKRDEQIIELTAYEYNALEYLILHHGKPISKTELTEHLYAQDFDRDSNVIEVFIGRLRRKLDPDGSLKPISTVRGQGYRFDLIADD
ncbi:response regulator transcription factor [Alkalimarinus sediminis]|uniref:Response regulator transcription factor n=1 Tax=Alkalimarinus sediminis TaxID=1632866 RepID=A0A9E8HGE5_9ALTE|nr:response regulator transcription factor [Alkalimarinus sediminis]UZW73742.1 response regulator transcription factor [Alkalimarinus sediminis]